MTTLGVLCCFALLFNLTCFFLNIIVYMYLCGIPKILNIARKSKCKTIYYSTKIDKFTSMAMKVAAMIAKRTLIPIRTTKATTALPSDAVAVYTARQRCTCTHVHVRFGPSQLSCEIWAQPAKLRDLGPAS